MDPDHIYRYASGRFEVFARQSPRQSELSLAISHLNSLNPLLLHPLSNPAPNN